MSERSDPSERAGAPRLSADSGYSCRERERAFGWRTTGGRCSSRPRDPAGRACPASGSRSAAGPRGFPGPGAFRAADAAPDADAFPGREAFPTAEAAPDAKAFPAYEAAPAPEAAPDAEAFPAREAFRAAEPAPDAEVSPDGEASPAEEVQAADAVTVTAATMAADVPREVAIGPPLVPPDARRRGARILIPVAVAVVLLMLVAIPLSIRALAGANSSGIHQRAVAASPSASPSSPPLTPEQYQLALDDFGKNIGSQFGGLASAHTSQAVRAAAAGLQSALESAVLGLEAVTPPVAARPAHDQFVFGLNSLGAQAGLTIETATSREVCGGASALSVITGSPAADQVRAGIVALGTADPAHAYKVAPFLPAATPLPNRRLSNGNFIKRPARGPNTLKVVNKFDVDLVLTLAPTGSKAASLAMYVRHGETASAISVPDGNYDIYMASGDDWDPGAKIFTRNCTYEQFNGAGDLKSTSRTYAIRTLTLGVEDGSGNMSGTDTDPGSIPT